MSSVRRGVLARLAAGGVAGATALAGITVGLATPAHAAAVGVTTTLTDPAGNGLDGEVTAYVQQPDGTYLYAADAVVADGAVSIAVEPGTYKFYFADESRVFSGEYYNDKLDFDSADAVAVAGPTALAPVSLAARATLSGQVVTAAGKPIDDASVRVYDATDNTQVTSVRTRPDGTWVAGVDAGSYKTYFSATGYAFEYYNNKPSLATADVVGAGANLGQVVLTRGGVVQGTVVNQAGAPLERARATVYDANGGQVGSDLTDANGNYRVEGVDPGVVKVQFSDPVDEYLTEWNSDKPDRATADPVDVGVEAAVTVNAALAPDPAAAIDPATVDLSGTVVDSSGAPVIGAEVVAYDTPADADKPAATDYALTDRSGVYRFTRLSETSETVYKVQANDVLEREEGQYRRLARWVGGAQTYDVAAPVTSPGIGANITLALTGGISGSVTSEAGLPVDSVGVRFFDEKGNPVAEGYSYVEDDGTYSATDLVPGTYKAQFFDSAAYDRYLVNYDAGNLRIHAPEWYDNTSFIKAKEITVTSGSTVTGIDAALSPDLRTFRKPEINGKPYLGGKVRAYPGVWSLDSGTTYTYQWLIGDTVVGTGSSYSLTKAAKNKRVTLRVIAENGVFNGTALTSSQVIKKKPKVKVSVKGAKASVTVSAKKVKAKKFKGSVVAKKLVRTDEYGAPVYKKIGKAKLRNGRASLTLKKLAKGKNKVVFLVTLKGGKYGDAEVMRTIKVKRR